MSVLRNYESPQGPYECSQSSKWRLEAGTEVNSPLRWPWRKSISRDIEATAIMPSTLTGSSAPVQDVPRTAALAGTCACS